MTLSYSSREVATLRNEMSLYDIKLSPETAWKLLRKVGDRQLCVDALLMSPQPAWLVSMLGGNKDTNDAHA